MRAATNQWRNHSVISLPLRSPSTSLHARHPTCVPLLSGKYAGVKEERPYSLSARFPNDRGGGSAAIHCILSSLSHEARANPKYGGGRERGGEPKEAADRARSATLLLLLLLNNDNANRLLQPSRVNSNQIILLSPHLAHQLALSCLKSAAGGE